MRLLITTILSLFIFPNSYASIICPSTISCSYEAGTCKGSGGFNLYPANIKPFTGWKEVNLTKIYATKRTDGSYHFMCDYFYDNNNSLFELYTNSVHKLVGQNWTYSGFGSQHADCANINDPSTCSGSFW